jgi:hypothetical protein
MLKRHASTGGNFDNPLIPHLNALIILTDDEYEKWKSRDIELEDSLRNAIRDISEIYCSPKNPTKSIHIEKFRRDDPESSFDRLLSYNYKADEQNNGRNADFPIPGVYPYNLDVVKPRLRDEISKRCELIESEIKRYNYDIDELLKKSSLDLSVIDQ